MGIIMLKDVQYGGVTQSEMETTLDVYQTREDEELETTSSEVVGAINELNLAITEVEERFEYSTTEKVVGKWVDGKTLYEKTYIFGIDDLSGTVTAEKFDGAFFLTGLGSIDTMWVENGCLLNPQGKTSGVYWIPMNYTSWDDTYVHATIQRASASVDFRIAWDETYAISNLYPIRNQLKFVFTLRYTKT